MFRDVSEEEVIKQIKGLFREVADVEAQVEVVGDDRINILVTESDEEKISASAVVFKTIHDNSEEHNLIIEVIVSEDENGNTVFQASFTEKNK